MVTSLQRPGVEVAQFEPAVAAEFRTGVAGFLGFKVAGSGTLPPQAPELRLYTSWHDFAYEFRDGDRWRSDEAHPWHPDELLWSGVQGFFGNGAITAAGGHYIDVAVLAPVEPSRLAVPLLISGDAADEALAMLRSIGFRDLRAIGGEVGRASAIKMIRSIMIKGVEALTDEMMAAAQRADVTEEVLASLDASEKLKPWAERAAYNMERMATHGLRRAAEMEEVAKTLTALDVAPVMTNGTVLRQRAAAGRGQQQET